MTDQRPDPEAARQRANEEAACWQLRIQNGDVDENDGVFLDWLSASPENGPAMTRAQRAWAALGEHAATPELVRARRDALGRSGRTVARRWRALGGTPVWTRTIAAAVAMALCVLPAAYLLTRHPGGEGRAAAEIYETTIGETRTTMLADNTRIALDASTRLTVAYSATARDIVLERGQAHFAVARDPARPFRVKAGGQTVTATGTAFNIEMIDGQVLVTLIEGEVVITEPEGSREAKWHAPPPASGELPPEVPAAMKLRPGEQLVASAAAPPRIEPAVNLEKTSAWRDGKVLLEGDTLAKAVERMNRYSRIRMTVADDGLGDLRLSGIFNAGDTDAFVEAVEAYFPVEARRMSASSIEFHSAR